MPIETSIQAMVGKWPSLNDQSIVLGGALLILLDIYYLKKWANPGLFFVYFRHFLITISGIQIEKT